MILFHSQNEFKLSKKMERKRWIKAAIEKEGKKCGDINYIFCSDEELLQVNREYLQHDYYTDIITFDYTEGDLISGDLYISTERIADNAKTYQVDFENELLRVLIHGIMHLCGYKDKTDSDAKVMRSKENFYINLFVKQK